MSKNMQGILTAIALMLVAVLIYAIYVTVAAAIDNHVQAEEIQQAKKIRTYEEEYFPGQSLDVVRVNAPTFSDCEYAYKMCDRTSGASGWYVRIEGDWVYAPVTLGNQQLIGAPVKEGE